MPSDFKRMTDFLTELGIERIAHTEKSYLAHLIGLYRYLQSQGAIEEICRAGMFHSIYGTERFQGFKLPLERRGDVRELIGERAENLAYLNCAMDRASPDALVDQQTESYRIKDRITGGEVTLNRQDYDDLCRVHLFDWLEQVPRCKRWDYRRPAYRGMARRLGNAVEQEYERVFALEQSAVNA